MNPRKRNEMYPYNTLTAKRDKEIRKRKKERNYLILTKETRDRKSVV